MSRVGQYEYSRANADDGIDIISLPAQGRMIRVPLSSLSPMSSERYRFRDVDLAARQNELSKKPPEIELRLVVFIDDFNQRVSATHAWLQSCHDVQSSVHLKNKAICCYLTPTVPVDFMRDFMATMSFTPEGVSPMSEQAGVRLFLKVNSHFSGMLTCQQDVIELQKTRRAFFTHLGRQTLS